ncbi:MAG TPA: hypothetical protein DDW50_03130 [Firmicutes bacterium]|jgi:hypothetical protein|nr:hypothetical protein [Bacillota bacterium]
MLHTEHIEVFNFPGAIRGMRNPKASWHLSDTVFDDASGALVTLGENDRKLAITLVTSGSDHRKFLRQIFVSMDIVAPDYWWKEMDTYKVGTAANSTSTMHKLTSRTLTGDDFSWDDLTPFREELMGHLNDLISRFKELTKNNETDQAKKIWRQLIQDLPMSFLYTRTWTGNYENLRNIYHARSNHKLSEWHDFCRVLESLPFSELITID